MGTGYRWFSLESLCYGWEVWAFTPPPVAECIYSGHLGNFRCESCLVIIKAHFIFCCPFLALLWKPMSLDGFFSPALTLMGQGRCMPQGLLKTKAGEMVKEAFCFGCFVPASLWSSLLTSSIPAGHPHRINSFSHLWVMFFFPLYSENWEYCCIMGTVGSTCLACSWAWGHHKRPWAEGAVGGTCWSKLRWEQFLDPPRENRLFLFCWKAFYSIQKFKYKSPGSKLAFQYSDF